MALTFTDEKLVRKQFVGIPSSEFPRQVDLAFEARRGRERLYPVTIIYTALALGLIAWAISHSLWALLALPMGVLVWTHVEYLAHRYVLHGVFPDGQNAWQKFLHRRFDGLHWFHHLRPWDGAHINGTLKDTGIFVAPIALLAIWQGSPLVLALAGAFIQSYVIEEWVHHSVHFYRFKNPYFRYIRRHHLYHHSPRGQEVAFGLTNGFWDLLCGTRIPAVDRRLLYGRRPGRPSSAGPCSMQAPAHAGSACR